MSKKTKNSEQDAVDIDVNAFEEKPIVDEQVVETPAEEAGVANDSEPQGQDEPSGDTADLEVDAMDVIEKLNVENAQLKDQLLRSRAETENVRRRGERDKADAGAYAVTGFARDMLAVGDNLRRTLDAMPDDVAEDMKAFVEGVELTERELLKTFTRHGIELVNPDLGEKFDANFHQAMFEMESDEHDQGSIAQVVAQGYVIKDRLLRPAMVGTVKKK